MDASHVEQDLVNVLFTEKQIQDRLGELAREIESDYEGQDLLIVGILRGAVMVMADLARSLSRHIEMDWMAISSYGSGTKSSGVVRILKDLDTDITGRHVLIVDEIIDSGLTLSWLTSNLSSREPASVEICTLLRKPEALQMPVEVEVRRLGHPQRVRRRLRPRLPRAVPQPARHRHPDPARLQLRDVLSVSPVGRETRAGRVKLRPSSVRFARQAPGRHRTPSPVRGNVRVPLARSA